MEWEALPGDLRERIDRELRASRVLPAVQLLLAAGGVGLSDAHQLIIERFHQWYPPRPPADPAELAARARAIHEPVVAVEAFWAGDPAGWLVELVAIVERPGPCHDRYDQEALASFRHGSDLRLFNGTVPAWPEAAEAAVAGQAVARRLGVPFHFSHPHAPDVDLPRWWDRR